MKRFHYLIWLCLIPLILSPLTQTPTLSSAGDGVVFVDSGQNLGNEFSTDVSLGDLDGDGDQDAFVTNGAADQNQVWLNQGGQQGGTEGIFEDSGQPLSNLSQRGLALGDLDGDTDLDAFVVRGIVGDSLQVWINQGGTQGGTPGIFQQNAFTVDDDLGTNVILGDVDGDTDLDAYVSRIFDTDRLFLNDGSGLFSDSGQILEAGDASGAGLADLDGDGDLDLFVAVQNGANTIWINQGGAQGGSEGVFADSGQMLGGDLSLNVALGDLDNDMDIDAFVANSAENVVWINQGGAQGGKPGTFEFNGQLLGVGSSTDVKLADLDGDNDLDAFVSNFGTNTVWVNQGGEQGGAIGHFVDSGLALGMATSTAVSLADVDGDGDSDAFVSNSGPAPNKVYLNTGGTPLPPLNPVGWQMETVDTRGLTGLYSSIALDNNDRPHIAFVTQYNRSSGVYAGLRYGRWDGIRWQNTTIDEAAYFSPNLELRLDSRGYPHLLYQAGSSNNQQLIYAYWDGAAWQTDAFTEETDAELSLALDTQNQPHIVYILNEETNTELRYAFKSQGSWQTEILETASETRWEDLSLALDSNDRPHLGFFDNDPSLLNYAHNNGSGWQIETVDDDIVGIYPTLSLAVDGNNRPHIAYTRRDNVLGYAQWNGLSWQLQSILTAPFPSNFTSNVSLAFDSTDNPHIAYAYDEDDTIVSLRYLYGDGSQWQNETLDSSGAGHNNDIALDSNGRPHISYFKRGYGDLRYIKTGPTWQIRTVPDPGQTQAIDIQMAAGSPYLSYHNVDSTLFNITHWDTDWRINPLTGISSPITDASLHFTPNDRHLSFYDADNQRLMHVDLEATPAPLIRVVDNEGDVGRYNRLVIEGGPTRIAYWDETNRRLKMAFYQPATESFETVPNTLQPTLADGSGFLSATPLANRNAGVTYWDAANQALRYAVWHQDSETWIGDELVDASVGPFNALQTDTLDGYPVIAYYAADNDAILLAYRDESGWQTETAVSNAGNVTSIDLALGFGSRQFPRISYTTTGDSRFAAKQNGSWQVERISQSTPPTAAVALTLDNRPHLAYPTTGDGLQYIFRTATLDIWTRIAAEAGPELAGVINSELAQTNNLQDFVGLSFDEWAAVIGVAPPERTLYLPLLSTP